MSSVEIAKRAAFAGWRDRPRHIVSPDDGTHFCSGGECKIRVHDFRGHADGHVCGRITRGSGAGSGCRGWGEHASPVEWEIRDVCLCLGSGAIHVCGHDSHDNVRVVSHPDLGDTVCTVSSRVLSGREAKATNARWSDDASLEVSLYRQDGRGGSKVSDATFVSQQRGRMIAGVTKQRAAVDAQPKPKPKSGKPPAKKKGAALYTAGDGDIAGMRTVVTWLVSRLMGVTRMRYCAALERELWDTCRVAATAEAAELEPNIEGFASFFVTSQRGIPWLPAFLLYPPHGILVIVHIHVRTVLFAIQSLFAEAADFAVARGEKPKPVPFKKSFGALALIAAQGIYIDGTPVVARDPILAALVPNSALLPGLRIPCDMNVLKKITTTIRAYVEAAGKGWRERAREVAITKERVLSDDAPNRRPFLFD